MTAKIIEFPRQETLWQKEIENIIDNHLQHSDPDVLKAWQASLKGLLPQYMYLPDVEIELQLPPEYDENQAQFIGDLVAQSIESYQDSCRSQQRGMVMEMAMQQKRICELEINGYST
ncbi:hypothetical protein [Pelagibaculum spongiae]|uniref:Uncharacterized protein n=1 Tax=Pelagibaculum spongiae TaxID=2080658 RepID=A0A2V1GQR8_9GAMM|nr:hypothetical protein [Pelagibaculum spongiae]PVZ66408.1 hypothetical protein DC094_17085 [Pelagibaculum spongiae]